VYKCLRHVLVQSLSLRIPHGFGLRAQLSNSHIGICHRRSALQLRHDESERYILELEDRIQCVGIMKTTHVSIREGDAQSQKAPRVAAHGIGPASHPRANSALLPTTFHMNVLSLTSFI
jgi:hypothetical protein